MPVYIEALKEFNKGKKKFVIPKKGTAQYKKVISIMNKLKSYK